jgi:hypothetical protein
MCEENFQKIIDHRDCKIIAFEVKKRGFLNPSNQGQ